jgi:hypothetical protein
MLLTYMLYMCCIFEDFNGRMMSFQKARFIANRNLGYSHIFFQLILNINTQSSTIYSNEHFSQIQPIAIQRGTI